MLTKEQVLSASEDEFMTDEQLAYMQSQLLKMKEQLLGSDTDSIEPGRQSDPLDQAQQEMQFLVHLRKKSLDTDLLSEVEKALYKIQYGEYGFCEISGEPIDIRRLLASPTSRTSLEEQERLERNQLMAGS
jgi:DnaK suppressor protein